MAENSVIKYESAREIKTPSDEAKLWADEIRAAEKHLEKFWKRCEMIEAIYLDEQRDSELAGGLFPVERSKVNLFWSNTQVLKSMLYVRPPKIEVSRRYKDYSDDVARVAGEIMERLLNNDIERDESDFGTAVRQGIESWLIVGLGQLWMRYEARTERVQQPPVLAPDGVTELAPALDFERIVEEDALSDFVHWRDFLWSPARTWEEVRWIARRVRMTRDKGIARFGEKFETVPLNNSSSSRKDRELTSVQRDTPWAQGDVYEVWCLEDRTVRWCNPHCDYLLDKRPDPLGLERFWPAPRPLLGTTTSSDLVPRADYSMAQDQYQQTNILATRIRMLTEACKLVGVYDKNADGVQRMLNQGIESQLIPVDNWAAFAEKGGIKGSVDFLPIEVVSGVIQKLREDMAAQKEQLYEVLGIADIMRGLTRSTETATAQQIKAQYGSTRVQAKQFEVGTWVGAAQSIKAEIIAKHFQPQTILQRSNIANTPDAQFAEQAVQLIKDVWQSAYRLHIEPESMSAMDWSAEREARVQFLSAVSSFLQQAVPLGQMVPQATPALIQMIQWCAAGFRVGRSMESVLDQLAASMQQAGQQQQQGPSPQEQAEVEKTQSEAAKNKASAVKTAAETAQIAGMAGAPIGPAGLAPMPGGVSGA